MRAIVASTLLLAATPAQADSFVDLFGGISIPTADDDWTDTAETSPKIGLRAGAAPGQVGGFLQADWTPVNTDADGALGGAVDVTAHRFRVLVGPVLRHAVSNVLVVTGRAGLGIDIARATAEVAGFESEETDVGFALEFGAGLFFRAGKLEIGGEIGLPIAMHDNNPEAGEVPVEYTSFDVDLLFVARFLSE